jgi:hypothetical protein
MIMTDSLREMINAAKEHAESLDSEPVFVSTPDGKREVKRSKPSVHVESKEIDPSDVVVADDPHLTAMLVSQLYELRAAKRMMTEQEAAIKSVLESVVGDAQYISLAKGEDPIVSMKFESSVRIRSTAVKDLYPPEDFPDLYQNVQSRPLRLM